jgi:GDP-L-fucose synthase
MVGSALVRHLQREACDVLTIDRKGLDLRRQSDVDDWMGMTRPDAIFLAAGTVGGILANDSRPAEFLYDNIMIVGNVIEAARRAGVAKLLFLGSSCIYPRNAPQPMPEECLLAGPLEPTNQWYALAKISGIKLCEAYRRQYGCDFISAQPTNLYGPGDTYDLAASHVIPALIAKIHHAKVANSPSVEIWGTGRPRREFLHVDDLAEALIFLMQHYSDALHINIGSGEEYSIAGIAELIAEVVGYRGAFHFATEKPDGTPRKLLDRSRITALGWHPSITLRDGLPGAYQAYLRAERKIAASAET